MGCNTSKEVMRAAADATGGNEEGDSTAREGLDRAKTHFGAGLPSRDATPPDATVESKAAPPAAVPAEDFQKGANIATDPIQTPQTHQSQESVKRGVANINLSDPEANRAATKIQAAFRGHQTRRNMKQEDEMKRNLQKEFNPENRELCEAATKIQASFRGHLVRKSAPRKNEDEELSKEFEKLDAKEAEEIDIDLNDPDLQVAATKIQASFRGHRVRKEKQSGSNE